MLFCGVVVWPFVSAFFVFSLVDGADISPGTSLILARSSVLGLVAGSWPTIVSNNILLLSLSKSLVQTPALAGGVICSVSEVENEGSVEGRH